MDDVVGESNVAHSKERLSKAPIREALIDIQVQPGDGVTVADVKREFENTDFGYYQKGPIRTQSFAFGFGPSGAAPPASTSSEVGVRLHSKDEKYVLQVFANRFVLSRLRPYEQWGDLEAKAKRLWLHYQEKLKIEQVVRVAVRYINDLQLPMLPGDEFKKYFSDLVIVPQGSPTTVERFVQQFQLFDQKVGARVILTIALNGLQTTGIAPIILDIAVSKDVRIRSDQSELWDELRKMKDLKNKSFFGALTKEALELFR